MNWPKTLWTCLLLLIPIFDGYPQNSLGHGYEFSGNGKNYGATPLKSLYTLGNPGQFSVEMSPELQLALSKQANWLSKKNGEKQYQKGNLTFTNAQLQQAAELVKQHLQNKGTGLPKGVQAYQIKGEDGLGNVHFTGYFTPILKVKAEKDSTHQFPLYRFPKGWSGQLPNRRAIDGDKVLAGKGLELAWSANLLEVYYMHVQGSGYVEFPDGKRLMLLYGGKNGHNYKSIGKYLVNQGYISADRISMHTITEWFATHPDRRNPVLFSNPSYTFFAQENKRPSGAIGIPLEAGISIAVDPAYIPLGATLLAQVPILGKNGLVESHEYRILVAQDRGAAIKGSGHVDLYQGIGEPGMKAANNLHHYGKIWLLLPEGQKSN